MKENVMDFAVIIEQDEEGMYIAKFRTFQAVTRRGRQSNRLLKE